MHQERALAGQYRDHAQELRRVAAGKRPTPANRALIKAAEEYDRMAGKLERSGDVRPISRPC